MRAVVVEMGWKGTRREVFIPGQCSVESNRFLTSAFEEAANVRRAMETARYPLAAPTLSTPNLMWCRGPLLRDI